jgi:hydrogenase small subunit
MAAFRGIATGIRRPVGTSDRGSHHGDAIRRTKRRSTMTVSRRDFLKYCIGSAAVLGLDASVLGKLERALAAGGGPPVIWLNAANCTGCTVSLSNLVGTKKPADVGDLLINTINLAYHTNLMGAAGDLAVETLRHAAKEAYILVVEGGVPTAFGGAACILWTENGREVTAMEAVTALAPKAKAVVCVGTCSSFGGIPAAQPNPTGIKSVRALTGRRTVNIPGCPPHPDWIVGTLAQLLSGVKPKTDADGRPLAYFGGGVLHEKCPRRDNAWAMTTGVDNYCLRGLGCKGVVTGGDCPTRKWNNQTNWCVGANAICIGCTENGFPDKFSPFYSCAGVLPEDHPSVEGRCIECHSGLPA